MNQIQSIDTLSFEDALSELEKIVRALETGAAPLEESISTYERGVCLKQHCEKKLADARMKIEKISIAADGSVTSQPFTEET
ncbi:MAG: exodeoxyribonuclease VII small subunit [Rhodospirillales bacterium]|nr:exodeoxyribonuclease VII small subunit [Rhodospirillales bacterium]MCB9965829.1 exodeoxyribonuclease VII small subunit [Rhodospirillales bacterium]